MYKKFTTFLYEKQSVFADTEYKFYWHRNHLVLFHQSVWA